MARLIDADKLIYTDARDLVPTGGYVTIDDILKAPIVDTEEVVRCKDCRYCDRDEPEYPFCEKLNEYCKNFEWYCADAVKKGRPVEVQLEELAKWLGDIMRAVESSIVALDEIRKEVENAEEND